MSQTVADFIVQHLYQCVQHVFWVYWRWHQRRVRRDEPGRKIGFVQARHEEMAAFMATAYAKFSGQLGVCIASEMPVALEVKTAPEVPPLPPLITLQQAKNFSLALMKGDPNESGMIKGAARQVLVKILPGKE
ncbi:thiamine pyrophosphate-binding protein [Bradyrhizobium sp. cf659]|uniref:thiamine pyrophosphate-binding protein n=1 Tax=Bradyrhizobium sp. cf659 TaxID=1761771 RepID=UPI0008E67D34|nr:thiamine pyrophosphate-binding protein [Bradyrhizobium sp. cf659]SFJ07920.1 Thiamine pyrophosphate enzyme, N-terminal TPP binding domain [Bradyrhizobium sp. cf659]